MKRIVAMVLALTMCISLCSCSTSDKKAYEASQAAYENIDIAYQITEEFGGDIYEAWRMGIQNADEISVSYLSSKLGLTEDEIDEGIVYAIYTHSTDGNYDEATEEEKEQFRGAGDYFFRIMEDNLFLACVLVVVGAYKSNGKIEEIESALDAAKIQMKEMSEKYSDYEHYPNLKGYYTTTKSFFEFCKEPTGSFEQLKETVNEYRNEARDYISDLDYIFEE